jgi:transcriptional regulator with XRE-family HTH domain
MEIGEKIRHERNLLSMTLEQLAKKVGISKMTLHRIETGKTSPSIATLGDISQVLQKPISSFIDEENGFIRIIRKKEQFTLASNSLRSRILSPRGSINVPNGSLAINYVEAKGGTELKVHKNKGFEWVFQISGKSVFYYDKKKYISNPGDVFFYDGRRPHAVKYYGKNKFVLISFK